MQTHQLSLTLGDLVFEVCGRKEGCSQIGNHRDGEEEAVSLYNLVDPDIRHARPSMGDFDSLEDNEDTIEANGRGDGDEV